MSQIEKVYAYITRAGQLLVFRHVDYPDAGIQCPVGTVDRGETPDQAVLREASEETGLEDLAVKMFLGEDEYPASSTTPGRILRRYFYHLACPKDVPEIWQHQEHHPSDGTPGPIRFEFYWLAIDEADGELDPYFSTMLDKLLTSLTNPQEDMLM